MQNKGFSKYDVDEKGNIKNIRTGKTIKTRLDKGGYVRATLYDDKNSRCNILVHRLVGNKYLKKITGKTYINHIDGDKQNNSVENLEWCSMAENNYHKREVLNKRNGSEKKPIKCVETGEIFNSILEATKIKGLNRGDISHALNPNNAHKTAGGFHWELVKGEI